MLVEDHLTVEFANVSAIPAVDVVFTNPAHRMSRGVVDLLINDEGDRLAGFRV